MVLQGAFAAWTHRRKERSSVRCWVLLQEFVYQGVELLLGTEAAVVKSKM